MTLFQIEDSPSIVTSEEFISEEWIERGFWKHHEDEDKKNKDAFICFEFKRCVDNPKLDAEKIHYIMNHSVSGSKTPKMVKMSEIIGVNIEKK